MHIPIVGLVENMSYVSCPDCGKKIYLFGEGKTEEAAAKYGLPVLAKMPIDPALAKLVDEGDIESFEGDWLSGVVAEICNRCHPQLLSLFVDGLFDHEVGQSVHHFPEQCRRQQRVRPLKRQGSRTDMLAW